MSDILAWLQKLGLSKYAKAFEENEIDADSLPFLTENMLAQIGLPVGPRAKVLAAISQLPSASVRRDEALTAGHESARFRNERRQVTVMFCDLVDSTKLASTLDPEDLGSIFDAYQMACAKVITQFEGHIVQYRGDGIEVIFGWPTALEDAAERAVRAALQVIEAVKTVDSPQALSVRIGISTGIVVTGVGDLLSPSNAVGEALHIAARLEAIARPNSVVISETTNRLVSARFEIEDLGPQELKGVAASVRAFRVIRARDDTSRFQAALGKGMTPIVGRGPELAFLQERWRQALDGEGQAVFVSGVPGVGKSRIIYELEQTIKRERHITLNLQCLPHCVQSALFPVIQCIERLAKFTAEDSDNTKLTKVESLLAKIGADAVNATQLVAELISLPTDGRYQSLPLTAHQLKSQTLSLLVDLLIGYSKKSPILCILEDAHWIDPSTEELLDLLVGQVDKGHILLVVTHRPEYQVPFGVRANVTGLTIARLGRRDLADMVRLVFGDTPVSGAVADRIMNESDSIPLFVEELARGAIEAGELKDDEIPLTEQGPDLVPDSLRDSLMARLDRAPQARTVAQVAAVIGREFSFDMLHHITALSNSELNSTLERLQESDIVQLVDTRPPPRYAFRHSLLRDVAYESLLRSNRREIHARIAALLENEWPDIATGQPELLAYHYSFAGEAKHAARQWLAGGRRAHSRSANLEATVQLKKALECLEALPRNTESISTELDIQLSLGLCFIGVHGYSSDETKNAFERAYALSTEVGDARKETEALFGLWGHHWMRASHDRAVELSRLLLAKAEQLRDPVLQVLGLRCLGSTLFTLGDFVAAREHLEGAIALAQSTPTEKSRTAFAVDPRVAAQLMCGWDMWVLGYPEQARASVVEALSRAAELRDPYTAAFAHYVMSAVHLLRGESAEALIHADLSFQLSMEHRINLYLLYSQFGRGCALTKNGQTERGLIDIQAGIEGAHRSNLGYMRSFMVGWLGTALAQNGDAELALSTIDAALAAINDVSGRAWEAELHRLRGNVVLTAHPEAIEDAAASFERAIVIAQRQSARSLELRATTSLAQLLVRQGKKEQARDRLARIYNWFTEGADTDDLRQALLLLKDLGGA